MSQSSDDRGLKRICTGCGTRFYDLGKRPVICPNCAAEFSPGIKSPGRGRRNSADETDGQPDKNEMKAKAGKTQQTDNPEEADENLVSLEELGDVEEKKSKKDENDEIDIDENLDEELDDIDDSLDEDIDDIESDIDMEIDK